MVVVVYIVVVVVMNDELVRCVVVVTCKERERENASRSGQFGIFRSVTGWTKRVLGSISIAFVARAKVGRHAVVGADGVRWSATPPAATTLDFRYSGRECQCYTNTSDALLWSSGFR